MQNLYNSLITKGNISLQNAYVVGATIEDVDLYDLKIKVAVVDTQAELDAIINSPTETGF